MKLFVYKSLLVCFLFFVMFHLTFGYVIKSYKNKIYNSFSKDKISFLQDKIRNEVEKANKKDRILYPDDAELLKEFLNKIISEIR